MKGPWTKKEHEGFGSGNLYRLQIEITPDRIIQTIGQVEDTIENARFKVAPASSVKSLFGRFNRPGTVPLSMSDAGRIRSP